MHVEDLAIGVSLGWKYTQQSPRSVGSILQICSSFADPLACGAAATFTMRRQTSNRTLPIRNIWQGHGAVVNVTWNPVSLFVGADSLFEKPSTASLDLACLAFTFRATQVNGREPEDVIILIGRNRCATVVSTCHRSVPPWTVWPIDP